MTRTPLSANEFLKSLNLTGLANKGRSTSTKRNLLMKNLTQKQKKNQNDQNDEDKELLELKERKRQQRLKQEIIERQLREKELEKQKYLKHQEGNDDENIENENDNENNENEENNQNENENENENQNENHENENEKQRQLQEEQERQRQLQEEEEKQRKIKEEEERQRQLQEEEERQRQLQQEQEKQRQLQEEEEKQRKLKEEQEKQRQLQEEQEKQRQLQEEEEKQRKIQEEQERQKQLQEEQEKQRKIQEEQEKQRQLQQEQEKQRQLQQEQETQRQLQQEQEKQRQLQQEQLPYIVIKFLPPPPKIPPPLYPQTLSTNQNLNVNNLKETENRKLERTKTQDKNEMEIDKNETKNIITPDVSIDFPKKLVDTESEAKTETETETETDKDTQKESKEQGKEKEPEIPQKDWLTYAMRKHPEVLALRERTIPLTKHQTFGRLYDVSYSEVRRSLTRESIIQLVLDHFSISGFKKAKQALEEESGLKQRSVPDKVSGLFALLAVGIKNLDNLWELDYLHQGDKTDEDDEIFHVENYPGLGAEDDESQEDKPIWDEGPDSKDNIIFLDTKETEVKAGTLNKLIERLTSEKFHNTTYMDTFLMTYQSFTTPTKLLHKLIERYNVPNHLDLEEREFEKLKKAVKLRVCTVLKVWIKRHFKDFSQRLLREVYDFINTSLPTDGLLQMAKMLRAEISKHLDGKEDMTQVGMTQTEMDPKVPKNIFSPKLSIFDIDEEELARQQTLIEFRIYSKIQPTELLNLAWSKPHLKHRAPNVMELISKFNILSRWVTTCIVTTKKIRDRVKMFQRFIKLGECFRAINNFNGLMAILSGLNDSSVYRLKFTREEIPRRDKTTLQDLDTLMSTESSYKVYRETLSKSAICVPYLGVFLTDLTFIEEGNRDYLANLINFSKRKLICDVIFSVQRFQRNSYSIRPVHQIITLFEKLDPLSTQKCYELSLEIEPRGKERADIL